jgi:hypothetical protein
MLYLAGRGTFLIKSLVIVEVYSTGDEVELILNGDSLGKKKAGQAVKYRTLFKTTYQPGRLEAITYENGSIIGKEVLTTAGQAEKISLDPELDPSISENEESHNLNYINLSLCDKDGQVTTDDDTIFKTEIYGDAELYSIGSGDPRPLFEYKEKRAEPIMDEA